MSLWRCLGELMCCGRSFAEIPPSMSVPRPTWDLELVRLQMYSTWAMAWFGVGLSFGLFLSRPCVMKFRTRLRPMTPPRRAISLMVSSARCLCQCGFSWPPRSDLQLEWLAMTGRDVLSRSWSVARWLRWLRSWTSPRSSMASTMCLPSSVSPMSVPLPPA